MITYDKSITRKQRMTIAHFLKHKERFCLEHEDLTVVAGTHYEPGQIQKIRSRQAKAKLEKRKKEKVNKKK